MSGFFRRGCWENAAAAAKLVEAQYIYAQSAFEKGDYGLVVSLLEHSAGEREKELVKNAKLGMKLREARRRRVKILSLLAVGLLLLVALVSAVAYFLISRQAEAERQDLADNVFTTGSENDRFWQGKLGMMLVPGGDVIALDMDAAEEGEEPPVVYLSFHERDSHGLHLADSFTDFMDRYIEMCAVGPEDTQLQMFLDEYGDAPGLQSDGENAYLFRGALGIVW